jgi:cytochrome bd-type quinol oxidase subunit 1
MTAPDEARRILEIHNGDAGSALAVLERQLALLKARADVMMSLAGIIITVTGFSGRLIASTDRLAQVAIITALACVIVSVTWIFASVGRISWITRDLEGDATSALVRIIERRDRQTRAYSVGGVILCLGIALYAVAIGIMLFNPEPVSVPIR